MDLTGKVAVVTGGSRGIGADIAKLLGRLGAKVAVNYNKSADKAEEVVAAIKAFGSDALSCQADVANFDDAQKMMDQVKERWGTVHIVVTSAGMNWDGVIWKMTAEQWQRVIDVDLTGTFNFIRAAAPLFREQNYGRIITITSINGLRGKFGQSNYSAAKGGVIGLTKAAAKDLGKYQVTSNSVAPGFILTEMGEAMPDEFKQIAINEGVMKKAGKPEDVANLVAFLASDAAGHITGEVIKVDGGQYI
ncbi:MAG: SDR family oxidoreductase [Deltaproteobacteria bacterium]|nr:SDR family oxidoreductase [Candidatus Anaeroferrophillus wilburensis]MBN2888875.1 SDR family oxidoreductase [Deltaproteobacteria bacterium]